MSRERSLLRLVHLFQVIKSDTAGNAPKHNVSNGIRICLISLTNGSSEVVANFWTKPRRRRLANRLSSEADTGAHSTTFRCCTVYYVHYARERFR